MHSTVAPFNRRRSFCSPSSSQCTKALLPTSSARVRRGAHCVCRLLVLRARSATVVGAGVAAVAIRDGPDPVCPTASTVRIKSGTPAKCACTGESVWVDDASESELLSPSVDFRIFRNQPVLTIMAKPIVDIKVCRLPQLAASDPFYPCVMVVQGARIGVCICVNKKPPRRGGSIGPFEKADGQMLRLVCNCVSQLYAASKTP